MPSTPQIMPRSASVSAPQPPRECLFLTRQMAESLRGRILDLSGLALRAQANSLPKLACLLLAGSQPPRQ